MSAHTHTQAKGQISMVLVYYSQDTQHLESVYIYRERENSSAKLL